MSLTAVLSHPDASEGHLKDSLTLLKTTPEDVRRWLVAFFVELPNAPVYSARSGQASFVDLAKSPSGLDWPAFTAVILGARSRERLWVLTWARCEARRVAIAKGMPQPPAGGTVAEFCREAGVPRSSFERIVRASLERLANEWDRRRAGVIDLAE